MACLRGLIGRTGQRLERANWTEAFSTIILFGQRVTGRASEGIAYWILVLAAIALIVIALGYLEVRRRQSKVKRKPGYAVVFAGRKRFSLFGGREKKF